jgi:hypothetical protein
MGIRRRKDMKKHITTLLVFWGITIAVVVPGTAYAQFNLDKLKAIADKAKAYQEKMNQDPRNSPLIPNEGTVNQVGHESSLPSDAADDVMLKASRKKWDVVGVRMGMSLGEALKQLNTHNPRLEIGDKRTLKFADADNKDHPYFVLLLERDKSQPTPIEKFHIKVSMPPGQHVTYVRREKQYKKIGAPTMNTILAALRNKYGQPEKELSDHHGNYGYRHLLWQEGKHPGGNTVCEPSAPLKPPTVRPVKGCELIMISVNVQPFQDNHDVVKSLTITLTDLTMTRRDIEDSEHYFENARKNRKERELKDATKEPPPSL